MTKLATNNPGNLLASVTLPPTYIKLLISVNESVAERSAKKTKMNATHNKSLNTMKQKVKKLQREHESAVQKYKEVRVLSHTALVGSSFQRLTLPTSC